MSRLSFTLKLLVVLLFFLAVALLAYLFIFKNKKTAELPKNVTQNSTQQKQTTDKALWEAQIVTKGTSVVEGSTLGTIVLNPVRLLSVSPPTLLRKTARFQVEFTYQKKNFRIELESALPLFIDFTTPVPLENVQEKYITGGLYTVSGVFALPNTKLTPETFSKICANPETYAKVLNSAECEKALTGFGTKQFDADGISEKILSFSANNSPLISSDEVWITGMQPIDTSDQ